MVFLFLPSGFQKKALFLGLKGSRSSLRKGWAPPKGFPLRPHCLIKLLGRWRSEASLPPLTPWLCQPRRGLRPHRVSRCTPPEGGAFAPTSGCGEVEKRSFSSSPNPLPLWGSPEGAQSPHQVSRWPPRSPHRVSRWGLGKAQGV
jgi:hypothetical protein